ncbi:MAG: hypothetical protein ACRCTS_10365 [Fusobacteriaceae bacterium]
MSIKNHLKNHIISVKQPDKLQQQDEDWYFTTIKKIEKLKSQKEPHSQDDIDFLERSQIVLDLTAIIDKQFVPIGFHKPSLVASIVEAFGKEEGKRIEGYKTRKQELEKINDRLLPSLFHKLNNLLLCQNQKTKM